MSNVKSFNDSNGKAKQLRKVNGKFIHTGNANFIDGSDGVIEHQSTKVFKAVMHKIRF